MTPVAKALAQASRLWHALPMRTEFLVLLTTALALAMTGCAANSGAAAAPARSRPDVDLGAFSISLNVKDLAASRAFYEKLGFEHAGGDPKQNWIVLRNGDHVIGLFQGFIPKNTLTFNPGWTQQATPVAPFTDVRDLQAQLQQRGLVLTQGADPASTGPAYLMLMDPDDNPILIDQHVSRPRS